jgi:hypothetical protein
MLGFLIDYCLFTEKKNRANRDEPSRIPSLQEVSKTVPNAVSIKI